MARVLSNHTIKMSNDHRNLTRRIVHILHEFSTVDFWESNTFYSIILLTFLCFRQTLYMPLRQWIYAEDVGDLTIGWKWQEHDLTMGSKCVMNQKIWRRVWYIFYMIFQRFFLLLIERFQSTVLRWYRELKHISHMTYTYCYIMNTFMPSFSVKSDRCLI